LDIATVVGLPTVVLVSGMFFFWVIVMVTLVIVVVEVKVAGVPQGPATTFLPLKFLAGCFLKKKKCD
jgi:hypothetical protein